MKLYPTLLATLMFAPVANAETLNDSLVCGATTLTAIHTPGERDRLAAFIKPIFERIYPKLPTLSPSEQAWLKAEYQDQLGPNGASQRAISASTSTEFAKWYARMITAEIIQETAGIIKSQYDVGIEMREWTYLAMDIRDDSYASSLRKLAEAGILTEEDLPLPLDNFAIRMRLFGDCLTGKVIVQIPGDRYKD
ncbi:hypothetical protein ACCS44_29710 [Rhizobium ruizarguesonis]